MNFINIMTNQYPVTLLGIRQQYPNMSISSDADDAFFEDLGYAKVRPAERPVADVVIEGQPQLTPEGYYVQTFTGRAFNPMELAARANATKEQLCAEGMSYEFPDGSIGHVQLRDKDITKINSLLLRSLIEITNGNDSKEFDFRDKENKVHVMNATQVHEMCIAALEYEEDLCKAAWSTKDQA